MPVPQRHFPDGLSTCGSDHREPESSNGSFMSLNSESLIRCSVMSLKAHLAERNLYTRILHSLKPQRAARAEGAQSPVLGNSPALIGSRATRDLGGRTHFDVTGCIRSLFAGLRLFLPLQQRVKRLAVHPRLARGGADVAVATSRSAE